MTVISLKALVEAVERINQRSSPLLDAAYDHLLAALDYCYRQENPTGSNDMSNDIAAAFANLRIAIVSTLKASRELEHLLTRLDEAEYWASRAKPIASPTSELETLPDVAAPTSAEETPPA